MQFITSLVFIKVMEDGVSGHPGQSVQRHVVGVCAAAGVNVTAQPLREMETSARA